MSKRKGGNVGGWFFWTAVASALGAFVAVRLFDYLFSSASAGVAAVARPAAFAGVWTTVTTKLGLKAVADKVHGLRERLPKVKP